MTLQRWIIAVAFALQLAVGAAHAEAYWSYAYKGIDVTAVGGASFAVTLVQNLHRLDLAARKAMPSDHGDRPLTHVFAVPHTTFIELRGADEEITSMFMTTGGDNYVLIDISQSDENRYWEAYFGYAGSILVSNGGMRYPDWFRSGFSELFAATSIQGSKVTLGGFLPERVEILNSGTHIPIRTLLQLRPGDPQLKAASVAEMYAAESWFLTHLILFEGEHNAEFSRYLNLLDEGQSSEQAFTTSFKASDADLDRMFHDAWVAGRIRTSVLHVPLENDAGEPHRLSTAEADGRLAGLGVRVGRNLDGAIQRAQAALALEPSNEAALRALALAQVRRDEYASSLRTIDRIASDTSLSAAGHADRATVLRAIGRAITQQKVTLDADPVRLAHRAAEDYERSLQLDPENLTYWADLANLIAEQRDAAAAQTYFPRVVHVFFQHPRSLELATALTQMCAATNDYANAIRFANAWRENSISVAGRDEASAYVSRLKAAVAH